jgi:hypothetical protein
MQPTCCQRCRPLSSECSTGNRSAGQQFGACFRFAAAHLQLSCEQPPAIPRHFVAIPSSAALLAPATGVRQQGHLTKPILRLPAAGVHQHCGPRPLLLPAAGVRQPRPCHCQLPTAPRGSTSVELDCSAAGRYRPPRGDRTANRAGQHSCPGQFAQCQPQARPTVAVSRPSC